MRKIELFSSIGDAVRANPMVSIFVLLAVLWLIGVRLYNVFSLEAGSVRISTTVETFEDLTKGKTASDLSEVFNFAVLSAQVYGDPDDSGELLQDWAVEDCDYQAVLSKWKQLPLPDNLPTKPDKQTGEQAKWDSKLVFGVWYRENSDNEVIVAIVFRGTDGGGDFWSNFRWVTKYLSTGWDQYDLTRTIAPFVEKHVKNEVREFQDKKLRIVTAGHSLGGGLAHQAAYAASDIKTVYAFDGSSVTGFYSVDKEIRDQSKVGMRIYRMHERGEVLSYLRSFMNIIYPVVETDPQIIQITYNFDTGNAVGQHSIQKLACGLIKALRRPRPAG